MKSGARRAVPFRSRNSPLCKCAAKEDLCSRRETICTLYRRARNEEARVYVTRRVSSARLCARQRESEEEREIRDRARAPIRKRTEARQARLSSYVENRNLSILALPRRARSLAGREDERAYRRLGPVTYHYIDEILAGLVLFYSLSLCCTCHSILCVYVQLSKFIFSIDRVRRNDRTRYVHTSVRKKFLFSKNK